MFNHSNKTLNTGALLADKATMPLRTAYSYCRLSSAAQLKEGKRGLSRQLEAAVAYCRENNLHLDERLSFTDEGISAFKGLNKLKGNLSKFLKLVDAGTVRKSGVLIVESLDRISRENVLDAQELFLSIINRGISIVTLTDKQEYSRETIKQNPFMLIGSLLVMIRSNEESETKSKRVKDARQARRKRASEGTPIKVYCPPWCDWTGDNFKPNAQAVATIKRIFELYLSGKGALAIASTLNEDKVSYFGRGTAHKPYADRETVWYKKIVSNLLSDKRLIGHAHWIDKDDYFPAVISPKLFNQVQSRMSQRQRKGGQIGTGPINIFAGLIRCSCCNGAVTKVHCTNSEGYKYLYLCCENARSGKRANGNSKVRVCSYKSILFDAVEDSFLALMTLRPWFQEMLTDGGEGNAQEALIESLQGEVAVAEKQVVKFSTLVEDDDNPSQALVQKLKSWELKVKTIKAQLTIEEGKKAEMEAPAVDEQFFDTLHERMCDPNYRIRVREVLRSMIAKITLYVHDTEYPRYVVERTNGKKWSVVFRDTTSNLKKRNFQIFKGEAEVIDERPNEYAGNGREFYITEKAA